MNNINNHLAEVELDLYEMQSASHLGILRCLESIKYKENWGYNYQGTLNDKMAKSISGSLGESAVAKFLNIKFSFTCNHGGKADLIFKDLKIQVRTQLQKPNNKNSLIIRPSTAKQNEIYTLVIDQAPKFILSGFINSSTVLDKKEYLTDFGNNRPPCISIKPEMLTPIFLLKDGSYN